MGRFLSLPARTPAEIAGFAVMVVVVLVVLARTGALKRLGI